MELVSVRVRIHQLGRNYFRLKLNRDDLVTDLIQVVNEKTTLGVDIDLVTVKFEESIVDPGAPVSQYISTSSEEIIRLKHKEFSLPVSLPLSSVSTCSPLSVLSVIYHKHSLILSILPAFLSTKKGTFLVVRLSACTNNFSC